MLNNNQTPNVDSIMVCLHTCCLHKYNGLRDTTAIINDEHSGENEDGTFIYHVTNPRWCQRCVQIRGRAITKNFEPRIKHLKKKRAHEEDVRAEIAYLKGMRDGRIQALSEPFHGLSQGKSPELEDEDEEDHLEEIMDDLDDVEVGSRKIGDVERDENLAELIRKKNLGGEDIDQEFAICFQEDEARQLGHKQGKKLQLVHEWAAMKTTEEKRLRYMAMALL